MYDSDDSIPVRGCMLQILVWRLPDYERLVTGKPPVTDHTGTLHVTIHGRSQQDYGICHLLHSGEPLQRSS